MSDITKYKVDRYSLDKEYITTGELTVIENGPLTELYYKDTQVEETASDRGLPMVALIALRQTLETKHKSLLAVNGSRIDTTLRPTVGDIAYVIRDDKIDKDDWVAIFEPAIELDKLCTVQQHEKAYDEWCDAVCPKENFG